LWGDIISILHKLESFLRIDETLSAADLLRARAVYFAGAVVVLTQMFNLIFMTIIYGEWTLDHSISSLACLLIITATSLLRYSKNFAIFAAFYALLILTSVTVSALPDHMGINSSMFPLLMGGVILCGMISSWRSVAVYSVGAIGLVWMLYFDSMIHPVPNGVNPNDYATLSINKAVQTTLAFIIVSLTMGLFAICLDRIFTLLETNIQLAKQAERTKSSFLANMSHELCCRKRSYPRNSANIRILSMGVARGWSQLLMMFWIYLSSIQVRQLFSQIRLNYAI